MSSKSHDITRNSDEDLEEFKEIIEKKISRARGQLEYYEQQLQAMADNPDAKVKGLDDGTGTAESEAISSMALRQQKLLKHLENALIRIENKTYGVCRETGQLISKERLKAVPHATLSIAAKRNR
jgi:RNA polymerase-binding protein DksA